MNKLNIYISNHKTGSVLMFNILKDLCKIKNLKFKHDLTGNIDYNCDIFFHWNSDLIEKNLEELIKNYKIIYSIRHPYSIINSCYNYHKKMKNKKEKWCFEYIDKIKNTYNGFLNENTIRKGIEFEMSNNLVKESANNIIKRLIFLSNIKKKNIKSIKFEDFIFNFNKNMRIIYNHFNLSKYLTIDEFIKIANKHNINKDDFKKYHYTKNHILKYDRTHNFLDKNLKNKFKELFNNNIFEILNYREKSDFEYKLYNSKSILKLKFNEKKYNINKKILNLKINSIFIKDNLNIRSFFCNIERIKLNEFLVSERIIVKNNKKSNIRNWNGKYCFTLVRKIKFYDNLTQFQISKHFLIKNNLSDTRIIKFNNNFYFMGVVCKNKNINLCLYKLIKNEIELIYILNEITECKKEKNWSHFIYKDSLYFQYGFHPFKILKFKIDKLKKKTFFKKIKYIRNSYQNPIFNKSNLYDILDLNIVYFKNIYENSNKNIIFSPTTKLIKLKKNTYVGVGHIKVNYKKYNSKNFIIFLNKLKLKYKLDENINLWYDNYPNLIHKFNYIYLIFFYSINMINYDFKFSNFFIPNNKRRYNCNFSEYIHKIWM